MRLNNISAFVLGGCIAANTAAYSKEIHWEEEVSLPDGAVLWVSRSGSYSYKGAGGNPFDIALRPNAEHVIQFRWRGVRYTWKGDASLMLLAVSPAGQPSLVGNASDSRWGTKNDYKCVRPYYVQFVPLKPDHWTPLEKVEPWLYGLKANLMEGLPSDIKDLPTHVTRSWRDAWNADIWSRQPESHHIEPTYLPDYCKEKESQ